MANDTTYKVLELALHLREQPGCLSYDLVLGDDGDTWVFVGWWRTLAEAKAAAVAAMTAAGPAPMLALIEFASARYLFLRAERANV